MGKYKKGDYMKNNSILVLDVEELWRRRREK
jgi:hypothetical protein